MFSFSCPFSSHFLLPHLTVWRQRSETQFMLYCTHKASESVGAEAAKLTIRARWHPAYVVLTGINILNDCWKVTGIALVPLLLCCFILKHSVLTTCLFWCVQCKLEVFQCTHKILLRTFNVSTPLLYWWFPKYVQLRTHGHITDFHLSSPYFCFKFHICVLFLRDLFWKWVCLYIYHVSFWRRLSKPLWTGHELQFVIGNHDSSVLFLTL